MAGHGGKRAAQPAKGNQMNAENPDVIAAGRNDYRLLGRLLPGALQEIFAVGLRGDLMRQVVMLGDHWIGILAWGVASDPLHRRDQWIGWTPNQRAERLKLIAANLRFLSNDCHPVRQDWSATALREAMRHLPVQWENFFGYRPLLAESTLPRLAAPAAAFKADGWINLGGTTGRAAQQQWLKPIDPEGRRKLCAKPLQSPAAPGAGGHLSGLLPLPDALLKPLGDALAEVPDPRAGNRRFGIGSILAIVFMALVCGYNQVGEMHRFAQRLSRRQRALLGLPLKQDASMHDLPGYHVFYRLLREIDPMMVVEKLLAWLEANRGALPGVLRSDTELIRDAMFTLAFGYSPDQEAHAANRLPIQPETGPRDRPPQGPCSI